MCIVKKHVNISYEQQQYQQQQQGQAEYHQHQQTLVLTLTPPTWALLPCCPGARCHSNSAHTYSIWHDTIRDAIYDMIRDAISTCTQKPTGVSLIYRTEPTTNKWKTDCSDVSVNSLGNPCSQSWRRKRRLWCEALAENEGLKPGMKELGGDGILTIISMNVNKKKKTTTAKHLAAADFQCVYSTAKYSNRPYSC